VTRKTKFGFNENQRHHDQLIPKHAYLKDHNHFKIISVLSIKVA